jgi:hypothetical protein
MNAFDVFRIDLLEPPFAEALVDRGPARVIPLSGSATGSVTLKGD